MAPHTSSGTHPAETPPGIGLSEARWSAGGFAGPPGLNVTQRQLVRWF